MPEGPLGAPRLTNIGPISRATEDGIRAEWDTCPQSGKPNEICKAIKKSSIAILEGQGIFTNYETLKDINSGCCNRVASTVVDRVDDVRAIKVGDFDHVWLQYDGVHYDAEIPTGVNDYMEFPFFDRVSKEELLHHARMAKPKGEKPETFEDTVQDITDQIDERDEVSEK